MSILKIATRPVTAANWREAVALEVHPEQREFTPTVAISLAKAYIQPDGANYDPIAVYSGKTMIGFYSFIYYPGNLQFCSIGGFLIDKHHQGKGYGRAALVDFLTTIQRKYPECSDIFLTVNPRNEVAMRLYTSLGFVKTGNVSDGEAVMRYVIGQSPLGEQFAG
jgi:diamine N-acetyltransferase